MQNPYNLQPEDLEARYPQLEILDGGSRDPDGQYNYAGEVVYEVFHKYNPASDSFSASATWCARNGVEMIDD